MSKSVKKANFAILFLLLLFYNSNFFGQCDLQFKIVNQSNISIVDEYVHLTINQQEYFIFLKEKKMFLKDIPCDSVYRISIENPAFEPIDTLLLNSKTKETIQFIFRDKTILLDSIEIEHSHEIESKIKEVTDEIQLKNIQNGSQLFNIFSSIQSTSNSSTVQKPVLRYFHSQRLVILEDKLPVRDHSWGLDHGFEGGLSHIYDVNYSNNASPIYADYGALFVNNDVFHKQRYSTITTSYNHVNRKKNLGLSLNKFYKDHFFSFSSDLESSENLRVSKNSYRYLNSNYTLIDNQLSNTGRDKIFINLAYKFHEKLSFGISNNYSKTGLFTGASGIPNSYSLTNTKELQLPLQTANHFKIHGHFKKEWKEKSSFTSDMAWQQNKRNEFERAAFHGYNPLIKDTLGIALNFKNLDWLNTFYLHLDSLWCLKIEHSLNLGKNQIAGFDFIIPAYNQFENRGVISLEYFLQHKNSLNFILSYEHKNYQIKRHGVDVFQNNEFLSRIPTAQNINLTYQNLDLLALWKHEINKTLSTVISAGSAARTPEINELSSFGAHHGTYRFEKGNLNLKNERNVNIQGELQWQYKWLSSTFNTYFYHFANYIYLSPDNKFASTEVNGELVPLPVTGQMYLYKENRVTIGGFEFELTEKIKSTTFNHEIFYCRTQNIDTRLPLPFTAQTTIKNTIKHHFKKLENKFYRASLTLEHTLHLAQNRVARNERKTPAGNSLDLFGQLSWFQRNTLVKVNFGIQNILNQTYFIHINQFRFLNISEPSRNLYLGATIEF